MNKERITLTDTPMSAMIKMSEGNPGACTVLCKILKQGDKIDPDCSMAFMTFLLLDSFGIYGPRIWMLYKDVCKENIVHTLAVLRGVQLGLITIEVMNQAIDNYGEGLDVEKVLTKVQETLPNFGKTE